MSLSNKDIAEYYNTHQSIYNLFWSDTGLHYGFWEKDTKNLSEAIRNTDKFVIEILGISRDDVVLDAGCGVGGTSLYIAKKTGAQVEGVTLSEVQLKIAQKRASKAQVENLAHFSIQDYAKTNFKDGTFSKVFGIECICYAYNKLDFLKEAYRVLKPAGKIAVVDAFLTKENLDKEEKNIYEKFIEGWRVPNLSTKDSFKRDLGKAGFTNIVFHDKLENIKKSSQILYRFGLLTYPIEFIKSKLGIGWDNFSTFYQKALFNRIATYGVFVAEKPNIFNVKI